LKQCYYYFEGESRKKKIKKIFSLALYYCEKYLDYSVDTQMLLLNVMVNYNALRKFKTI